MAQLGSQLDAVRNPQTRCSNCQTVFEVSRDLLSSSDTRVRCGECLSIFDALAELRSVQEVENDAKRNTATASPATGRGNSGGHNYASGHTSPLDVTYSDFDLFSAEADLPEIAYFDQTRDTPDFDFDSVELGSDETFNDTLFVHDVTIDADATTLRAKNPIGQTSATPDYQQVGFVADEQPSEPLIFQYRDRDGDSDSNEAAVQPLSTIGSPSTKTGSAGLFANTGAKAGAGAAVAAAVGGAAAITGTTSGVTRQSRVKSSSDMASASVAASGAANTASSTVKGSAEVATQKSAAALSESVVEVPNKEALSATEQQAVELEGAKRSNPWFLRVTMLLLLALVLGGLFAYRVQPRIYNNATLRPLLETGCKVFKCSLPARVDVAALKMVKRNVYSHPNTPNTLVINISFLNDADFAQQLPVLHLVLSNRVGRNVAKQDFIPSNYFTGWNSNSVIDAKEQLDVKLEIADPGQDAQSFEFYFREQKP